MVRLLAISCANGLGHLRRLVAIIERFCEITPSTVAEVLCAEWQFERLRGWMTLESLLERGLVTTFGITTPGVEWRLDPGEYNDENLFGWEGRLARYDGLRTANLVVSDNLGAVVERRPDVVLAGSFLWSDTLATAYPDHASIARFADRERALLARHRPPMLCVEALATPGVLERTAAVPLPWMCELGDASKSSPDAEARRRPGARIGIATGASSVSDHRIDRIASGLAAAGAERGWTIAAPAAALRARGGALAPGPVDPSNVVPFRHGAEDYARADVVLCRPGAGALTQCVTHDVPILCLREPGNPEMEHNAARVEALGLGADLGEDPPMTTVLRAIEEALDASNLERVRQRLGRQRKDGLTRAAEWLVSLAGAPAGHGIHHV